MLSTANFGGNIDALLSITNVFFFCLPCVVLGPFYGKLSIRAITLCSFGPGTAVARYVATEFDTSSLV